MEKTPRSSNDASASRGNSEYEALTDRLFQGDPKAQISYPPVPFEKRQSLLERSIEALGQVRYLRIQSFDEDDQQAEMVRLSLVAGAPHPTEAVQADIRSVWRNHVVGSRTSLHVVRLTPRGFDFRFTLLDDGVFLTGVYQVELGP